MSFCDDSGDRALHDRLVDQMRPCQRPTTQRKWTRQATELQQEAKRLSVCAEVL